MNGQNNEFNSQFNNSANSNSNQPTQPVKNRFFSPDLFNDVNVNDVGSSTSNSVNNNVISWEVGQRNNNSSVNQNSQNNMVGSDVFSNSDDLLEQVNGTVYEVLDDDFLANDYNQNNYNQNSYNQSNYNQMSNQQMQDSQYGMQNSPFYQDTANTYMEQPQVVQPIEQPMPVQQPDLPMYQQPQNQGTFINSQQTSSMQPQQPNTSWRDGIGAVVPQGEEWMQQQPLSAAALGVETLTEDKPKDVVNESKFFNPNVGNNVQQNMNEQQQQYAMQYGNGQGVVLDDPLPEVDDMVLLKQYVGNSFTKLTMSPFSFPALLFSSLYFMYRKMFIIGVIVFAIEFAILNLLPLTFAMIADVVFRLAIALAVNPLYIGLAKAKIKQLRKKKGNIKKNQIELNTMCQRSGGTSLSKAFIIFIICIVISVVLSFMVVSNSLLSKVLDYINNGIGIKNEVKYEGTINLEDYDVLENINIEIPSVFKKDGDIFRYVYTTEGTGVFNNCSLTIGKLKGFSSGEDFITQYIEYEKLDANIGKTTSKGITWYTVTNEGSMGKQFYRAALINDDVILFDYNIGADTPVGVCDTQLVRILDSISLKE